VEMKKECKQQKKELKTVKSQLDEAETLLSAMENMNVMGTMGIRGITMQKEAKSGDKQKDNLFNDDALFEDDADIFDADDGQQNIWAQLKGQATRYINRNIPLQNDIASIESRYGKSVVFYFAFLRWMLLNYAVAAMPCVVFLTWHLVTIYDEKYDYGFLSDNGKTWKYTNGSEYYLLIQSVQFPSFFPEEALWYLCAVCGSQIILMAGAIQKLVEEDQNTKKLKATQRQSENKFCTVVLCAVDFSIRSQQEADEARFTNGEEIRLVADEYKMRTKLKERPLSKSLKLWAIRFLG